MQKLIDTLKQKEEELIIQIQKLENNGLRSSVLNNTGELSSYDNHPADLGSETFERSKDLGLKDNERVMLDSVRRALGKAETGTYGKCDKCGVEIGFERLEALPWATECINCSRLLENENKNRRPLEEESLEPIFTHSYQHHKKTDSKNFEPDDALDLVTQYGSSDSPQDMPGTDGYKNLIP
jgi:YteA family regulatory protein